MFYKLLQAGGKNLTGQHGLIHIYTGDGKGKTTAAIGLSIRFAGNCGNVLFTQFLKDDKSSEINILKKINNITFMASGKNFGFTRSMTPEIKELAKTHFSQYLYQALENVTLKSNNFELLVLDEIIAADNFELIPHEKLISFLKNKPKNLEVVLTGRNPSDDIISLADYVSEIKKIKHPYDKKISARAGIEY